MTEQIEFTNRELEQIAQAGPMGRALRDDIQQWWEFWDRDRNVPHDPVAVLTVLRPDLFQFTGPGTVIISCGGTDAGRSTFTPDPTGSVRLVKTLSRDLVIEEIVARIEAVTVSDVQSPAARP